MAGPTCARFRIFPRQHLQFAGVMIMQLAEGEISELHVGLKGTMPALFRKDPAAKTRRGLRDRVEQGRSGSGLCCGYDVVRATDAVGEPVRGERTVNKQGAFVGRRVLRDDFTAGVETEASQGQDLCRSRGGRSDAGEPGRGKLPQRLSGPAGIDALMRSIAPERATPSTAHHARTRCRRMKRRRKGPRRGRPAAEGTTRSARRIRGGAEIVSLGIRNYGNKLASSPERHPRDRPRLAFTARYRRPATRALAFWWTRRLGSPCRVPAAVGHATASREPFTTCP